MNNNYRTLYNNNNTMYSSTLNAYSLYVDDEADDIYIIWLFV